MKKRTDFLNLETFFAASLGVHLLLFLALSAFSNDTARSLISSPRLEVDLLSIASPAIAEEKFLPQPVPPPFQRKVQPSPLKIQHPEVNSIGKLNPSVQTASIDATEKERRMPLIREEEKPREESPVKEPTVEWTDSSLPRDEEFPSIETVASKESSSSALVISSPQEAKTSSLGGGQKDEVQFAKRVPPFEGETSFTLPRYLNNPKPIYPQEARQREVQGEVTLRVEVLASGRVGQIEIRRSSGHESLDRSALATVKKWQFVPAKKGKENIPLWVNIPITFRIE